MFNYVFNLYLLTSNTQSHFNELMDLPDKSQLSRSRPPAGQHKQQGNSPQTSEQDQSKLSIQNSSDLTANLGITTPWSKVDRGFRFTLGELGVK